MREELRRINQLITLEHKDEIEATIKEVLRLSDMAKQDGLLYIEDYAEKIIEDNELKKGLMLILDGFDYDIIKNILWNQYYANGYEGLEALKEIFYIITCLRIQEGTQTSMLELELKSLLKREILYKLDNNIHKAVQKCVSNELEKDTCQTETTEAAKTDNNGMLSPEEVALLLSGIKLD